MQELVSVVPRRVVRRYRCEQCRTKHRSRAQAARCEAMPVEERRFRVGDAVTWREPRHCSAFDRSYRVRGRVLSVRGPQLPDEEYNNKWLGGMLAGTHVFQYEVSWRCPHCKEPQAGLFYGAELRRLPIRRYSKSPR